MSGSLTRRRAVRAWWALAMVLVASIMVAVVCIIYTNHVQHDSDQRWCALLASLDAPETPATTPRGRQVQQQIHQLRRELHCKE